LRRFGQSAHDIELNVVLQATYEAWKAKYSVGIPKSPAVPAGGSFVDVEELTNTSDFPAAFSLTISETVFKDATRQIIDMAWSQTQASKNDPSKPVPYEDLYVWSRSVSNIEQNKTLKELGFRSGDLVVLDRVGMPLAMIAGRTNKRELPRDLDSFFTAVIQDIKESRALADWDGEYNPSFVGALALYTEEDVELARYVRPNTAWSASIGICCTPVYSRRFQS
jgi:hypothetical protein